MTVLLYFGSYLKMSKDCGNENIKYDIDTWSVRVVWCKFSQQSVKDQSLEIPSLIYENVAKMS